MRPSDKKPLALVTGASGFIGSHLAEKLAGQGWRVRALLRTTSDLRWLQGRDLSLADGSFDHPASLADAVRGVDYIFHNAAAKAGSRQRIFHDNVDSTMALAAAAAKNAPGLKRFVFLSSQAAAGPAAGLGSPKREADECRPVSDYGQSKLEAERRLAEMATLPLTVVRPPTVYGPRDRDVLLYFRWIDRGIALLPGLRERYANLIYVHDLVEGLSLAAQAESSLGKAYFLSDPQAYSWSQVSGAIAKCLGRRPLKLHLPLGLARFSALLAEGRARLAGRESIFNRQKVNEMEQLCWTCSPSRAEKDLGFSCRYGLNAGMAETARWYRDNGWL
jgi:nucleoside-diphosphate-sugar epimerase